MRILVVSDIHYSLRQFDWLSEVCSDWDLLVIAGDLMELACSVDPDTQAAVVEQYFRKISQRTPLVVCSGNHDLIEDFEGVRSNEWLEELAIPGLTVDRGLYENEQLRILSLPWWETEEEKARAAAFLEAQYRPDEERPVFWVHHAPPLGAKTSWNGKRDLGDKTIVEWIEKYSPNLVLSGHVHNAPYYAEGSWIDRIGETVVINGGRQTGDRPATVEIEVENGSLVWCGMEGCEKASLEVG
jgi:Icc-related predicted phosphoesterase